MKVVFCAQPFASNTPDIVYEDEAQAVSDLGLRYELINFEALVDDANVRAALARVKGSDAPEIAVYRGWMLTPQQYAQLYEGLQQRGLQLINNPQQYRHCHYLPESYPVIESATPQTIHLPYREPLDFDLVMELLARFGDRPLILKDYVKSRKHEWNEACYIPSASDRKAVESVVKRFIELQGDQLNEGLVFREYVELQPLAIHSKSGMPLTKEFRLFFLDGELINASEYWEEGDYADDKPPAYLFDDIAKRVQSRFFTMDIAQRTTSEWLIVELGDAQVAGLPARQDIQSFYQKLKERL